MQNRTTGVRAYIISLKSKSKLIQYQNQNQDQNQCQNQIRFCLRLEIQHEFWLWPFFWPCFPLYLQCAALCCCLFEYMNQSLSLLLPSMHLLSIPAFSFTSLVFPWSIFNAPTCLLTTNALVSPFQLTVSLYFVVIQTPESLNLHSHIPSVSFSLDFFVSLFLLFYLITFSLSFRPLSHPILLLCYSISPN